MAYTDFEFYATIYHGNVVPEADFPRIADRASDFLDVITFDRLVDGLPSDERAATKVQKAVCAVSDELYELELAEKQALSAAAGKAAPVSRPLSDSAHTALLRGPPAPAHTHAHTHTHAHAHTHPAAPHSPARTQRPGSLIAPFLRHPPMFCPQTLPTTTTTPWGSLERAPRVAVPFFSVQKTGGCS